MTHSCVGHLPLPLWLNEGLAQAMERRFAPTFEDAQSKVDRLRKQSSFWTPESIQEFWSGHAFHRPDDRQAMAYALALSITAAFAQDWSRFKAFVLNARHEDAAARASGEHLDIDLGEYLQQLLKQPGGNWEPQPTAWADIAEAEAPALEDDDRVAGASESA
jgi:hypothetical protein